MSRPMSRPKSHPKSQPAPQPAEAEVRQLPPQRRRIWPLVLFCIAMVPIFGVVACAALVGFESNRAEAGNKGGTAAFGAAFEYSDGLAIAAAAPTTYTPKSALELNPGEAALAITFTVTNHTNKPISMTQFSANATFNHSPSAKVLGADASPDQDVAPGQSITITQAFKVPPGGTGPFQIAAKHAFKEAVFFNAMVE